MLWWTLQQLKSRDAKARLHAVQKLGEAGGDRAVAALVDALTDPASTVRWQAAKSLQELGWVPTDDRERASAAIARGDIEQASRFGLAAFEALVLALRSGSYTERLAAAKVLGQIHDPRAVKELAAALKDDDPQVRAAVVDALCRIGDRTTVVPLLDALEDGHDYVRAVAAEALGQIADPQAFEPLLQALRDRHWEVRQMAALALAKFRDPRAVEPIGALLRDPEKEVREAAACALGQIGDPRAMGVLAPALVDAVDSVRARANASLRLLDPHWEESEALRASIPNFQDALKDKGYRVRQAAADVLAKVSRLQTSAVPTAPTELAQPAVQPRQLALEMFLAMLQDFDRELRVAAAEALGRLGQKAATPALTAGLQDPDLAVRAAVQQALRALMQPAGTAKNPAASEISAP